MITVKHMFHVHEILCILQKFSKVIIAYAKSFSKLNSLLLLKYDMQNCTKKQFAKDYASKSVAVFNQSFHHDQCGLIAL